MTHGDPKKTSFVPEEQLNLKNRNAKRVMKNNAKAAVAAEQKSSDAFQRDLLYHYSPDSADMQKKEVDQRFKQLFTKQIAAMHVVEE